MGTPSLEAPFDLAQVVFLRVQLLQTSLLDKGGTCVVRHRQQRKTIEVACLAVARLTLLVVTPRPSSTMDVAAKPAPRPPMSPGLTGRSKADHFHPPAALG